jgi:hypothetical protein
MSTYDYRSCPVCCSGKSIYSGGHTEKAMPDVSLLMLVSTVRVDPRKQKSSGALAMCTDCLAKILDGKPLPKKLRDGMADACTKMGVQVQRSLPLDAKPKKRKAAAK